MDLPKKVSCIWFSIQIIHSCGAKVMKHLKWQKSITVFHPLSLWRDRARLGFVYQRRNGIGMAGIDSCKDYLLNFKTATDFIVMSVIRFLGQDVANDNFLLVGGTTSCSRSTCPIPLGIYLFVTTVLVWVLSEYYVARIDIVDRHRS